MFFDLDLDLGLDPGGVPLPMALLGRLPGRPAASGA
jgi:hypothetical protein